MQLCAGAHGGRGSFGGGQAGGHAEAVAVEGDKRDPQIKAFTETVAQIREFAQKTNNALEQVTRSEGSWFWTMLSKIFK